MSGIPDYPIETTFDVKFTTRAFATGIPTTLAGTPAIEIYEDNSITQITAAETLTVDFDSVTGLNNLRIVATAANGFESGKSYAAVISAGTVNSVSVVGEVVLNFSIERAAALRPTVAGRTLDVSAGGEAGIDWANVGSPTTAVNLSGTNIDVDQVVASVSGAVGSVTGAVGSVTGAVNSVTGDVGGNVVGTVASVVGAVGSVTGHTPQTGDTFALANGANGFVATKADTAAILIDTAEIGAAGAGLTAIPTIAAVTTVTNLTNAPTAGDLTATMKASVNTEIVDAVGVDTIPELADAIPAATPTMRTALMLLYMALRNKVDITATLKEVHNDAGAVVAKKTLSDDGTTYSEAEMAAGT